MARILLIEDNELVREILCDLLEEEGHEVLHAEEGTQGLRMLGDFPADVVITDILMPGQEGIETIQELRLTRPHIKIVAISGGGTRFGISFLEMAEKLGADATLNKPIDAGELVRTVDELLRSGGDAGNMAKSAS